MQYTAGKQRLFRNIERYKASKQSPHCTCSNASTLLFQAAGLVIRSTQSWLLDTALLVALCSRGRADGLTGSRCSQLPLFSVLRPNDTDNHEVAAVVRCTRCCVRHVVDNASHGALHAVPTRFAGRECERDCRNWTAQPICRFYRWCELPEQKIC